MEKKIVFERIGTIRKRAEISESSIIPGWSVSFYYDGFPDYEWKRGSNGVACDTGLTKKQAIRKARYYVTREY